MIFNLEPATAPDTRLLGRSRSAPAPSVPAGLRMLGLRTAEPYIAEMRAADRAVSISNPRQPVTRAVVCVPAKNEALRLPAFFDAMGEAVARAQLRGMACEIVIALDGCTDASAAIVEALTLSFICPVRAVHLPEFGTPHAGRARKAAMDAAFGTHPTPHLAEEATTVLTTAIMTTDADTRVDPDWIAASADALARTDLVAGWVDWDDEEDVSELSDQERYFDALHRHRRTLDPVAFDAPDPHHKMYGASLAIRADAYVRVGGLPQLRSSEDVALTRAVRLAGLRMRQDRSVRVTTSTRRAGRATGGFSDAIVSDAQRRECGGLMEVDDPRYLTKCYRESARLRQAFQAASGEAGLSRSPRCVESWNDGEGTAIPDFEFQQAWAASPSADAFVTRLMDPLPDANSIPRVPLAHAWTLLDELKEENAP